MCGIFGANWKSSDDVERARLSINNRGPDYTNTVKVDNFYFSHNRLSIQDLSSKSNQPFHYKDSILLYNGELWNEQSLNLLNCDGDVEKFADYLYYNLDNLKEINGMFAFSFYKDSILYLGRDHIGEIPIYYYHNGNKFCFASEIKAIKAFEESISIKEIKLLPPGSLLSFDGNSVDIKQWYEIPTQIIDRPQEDIILNLRNLIEKATLTKIPKEVPYTVLLSGGIDSSIIAYLLHKVNPNIEAFTVSLSGRESKKLSHDLYHAREMAKFLNIKLHEINIDEDYVIQNINKTVEVIEDKSWTQVSSGLPHLAMANEIKKLGYKVVFSGSGSDELFASYPTEKRWSYYDDKYHEARCNLIKKIHKTNTIRENKCMMHYSQEIRSPFLEKNFVEYAMSIPVRYRYLNKRMKPLLRMAFDKEIPENILWREKVCEGDGVGIEYMVKNQKQNIIDHYKKVYK